MVACNTPLMVYLFEGDGCEIVFAAIGRCCGQLHVAVAEEDIRARQNRSRMEDEHYQHRRVSCGSELAVAGFADALDVELSWSPRPEIETYELMCIAPSVDHPLRGHVSCSLILGICPRTEHST